jgi:ribosomal protein S18 acetylase RimI-like enzyme
MSETTTATPILDPQKFTMQDYLARERPIRGLAERDALDAGATVEYQLAKENRSVVALVDGTDVGEFLWTPRGSIESIAVAKLLRRRGIATGMLQHAQASGERVTHSNERTEDGDLWAQALGAPTAKVHLHQWEFDHPYN